MTSNIGARQLSDFGQGVGFSSTKKKEKEEVDEHASGVIQNALKKAFAPEFLNRIDDVVVFNSLSKENIHDIIDIELESLYGRINELGYNINLTEKAKDFIADKGYDAAFGARPLKRAIQKYVEDPLAEEIIQSTVKEGDNIKIDLDEVTQELVITTINKPKKKKKNPDVESDKEE